MSYRAAKTFLEERGVAVYNATAGGKLDVYPRVSYFDLFPRAGSGTAG